MKRNNILFFLFFLLYTTLFSATSIDCNKEYNNLLAKSTLFLDTENLHVNDMNNSTFYTPKNSTKLNLGFTNNTKLWVKLLLKNSSENNCSKILQIRNPLLERVTLYDGLKSRTKTFLDKGSTKEIHTTFLLSLAPHETKTYYLKIENTTTALRFSLALKDTLNYIHQEYHEQIIIYIFFTILALLMFYNFILFLYTRENSYIFYAFYLFALLFQQSTYLGMTQLYLPPWFLYYDNLSVVFKVNMLLISAIFFARSFLKTQRYRAIDRVYKLLLILGFIEIPLFGTSWFYYPEVAIITALIFIYFNMFASIYIYKKGHKQARLFIVGWFFQLIGFTLIIIDGLGFISIMDEMPNIVMFFTSIEAISLSLAFIDRYIILKSEKELSDAKLLNELQNRQKIVEEEIQKATTQLNTSLENEKNLLKELQHRTKNNLQLILSLIRMQSNKLDEKTKLPCKDLEGRINTIAQTQQILYINNNIQKIDMSEYIATLCSYLESSSPKEIECNLNIKRISMPIKEAGYIGLIVNELLTNSVKYVSKEPVIIDLSFQHTSSSFILEYKDNSEGFSKAQLQKNTLGLELVKTLVETQLEGEFLMQHHHKLHYTIRFQL